MEQNPPTSSERRACENFRILSSSQASPASQASQSSQPASQASQPGQPGIEASGLQASMSAILSIGAPARFLRAPQGGTGSHRADNLLAPTAPGGAAKHATNPSNIDDMTNFPSNRVMGRPFHGFRVPIKIL